MSFELNYNEINESKVDISDPEIEKFVIDKIKEFDIQLNNDNLEAEIQNVLRHQDYIRFCFSDSEIYVVGGTKKIMSFDISSDLIMYDELETLISNCYSKLLEKLENFGYRVSEEDNINFSVFCTEDTEIRIYLFTL